MESKKNILYLKPCPFCGKTPQVLGDHRGEDVSCENDDCLVNPGTGEFYKTCEEAAAVWNKRSE